MFPIDHDCDEYLASLQCKEIKSGTSVSVAPANVTVNVTGTTAGDKTAQFQVTDTAIIKQLFDLFDRDKDEHLSMAEYSQFTSYTEGAETDEKRWKLHCKTLDVVPDGPGINFAAFAKLYTEPRFKKHFGKQKADMSNAQAKFEEGNQPDPLDDIVTTSAEAAKNADPSTLAAMISDNLAAATDKAGGEPSMQAAAKLAG
eukprot:SAG31_NODE_9767_length_1230_cov_1.596817_1_plen_199_part_10